MKCVEVYKELYHQEPFDVAFCPYRISPLGAHIDHQYGKINGLAIDKGIHMAYHPKQNGVVELQSLNFPKRAQFFVSSVPDEKQGDWADHLRGAAKMLGEKYRLKVGLCYRYLIDEKHYPFSTTDEYLAEPTVGDCHAFSACGQTVLLESPHLAAALSSLSELEQEILFLYFFECMTHREIGKRHGRTRSAIGRRIQVILRRLRVELEGLHHEPATSL